MKFKQSIYILTMSQQQAQTRTNNYLCSTCWGSLTVWIQEDRDSYLVLCIKCDEDTRGFTHKAEVERKRNEDHFNAQEVRKAYPSLDPNPKEKKSAEDNIKDLGL